MAKRKLITLPDAIAAGNHAAMADWLERRALGEYNSTAWFADETGKHRQIARLLKAAATYRLVVAQEQTAYLLQRLVDAAERDK